ncbi:MAG: ATP-dependent helicase [Bacteroidetes bacterium]|nr:ATP-dependent helicase [Bacteroidota bacterium]
MNSGKIKQEKNFAEILSKLNKVQKQAVTNENGPVLVIAGPGTGKTQILSARIGYLLESKDLQVNPYNILCLTYTEAATVSMRERLIEFIGPIAHRVNIFTFHAFCNEVLQRNAHYFGKQELDLISDLEEIKLLQDIIDELDADSPLKRFRGDAYFDTKRLLNLFKVMKEEYWSPDDVSSAVVRYLEDIPSREKFIYKRANSKQGIKIGDPKQKDLEAEKDKMEKLSAASSLFSVYLEKMKEINRYDYSDMILWVLNAFKDDEDFLRRYQEQYQYFLVDEYQDTNGSQNELLRLLIDYWENPDVFVVGDDDQSIYRFQGANVKNIEDFDKHFRNNITRCVLTENYRSSRNVLLVAESLIGNNKERLINKLDGLEKKLIAANKNLADSKVVPSIKKFSNITHEEAWIVDELAKLHKAGEDLSETAVIYSKHRLAENIIQAVEKLEIPYSVSRKIDILNIPIIKHIINILKYVQLESKRSLSGEYLLFEILHYDYFDISVNDILKLSMILQKHSSDHRDWRTLLADKKFLLTQDLENELALEEFEGLISSWIQQAINLPLQIFVEKVINTSNILAYVLASENKIWLIQLISSFYNFIKSENVKHPRMTITKLMEQLDLMIQNGISIYVEKVINQDNGVNFLTAHAAKGKEFERVYVIAANKQNWESKRSAGAINFSIPDTLLISNEGNEIEESRRLFFVAITRAKEFLNITYPVLKLNDKPLEQSAFVDEILLGAGLTTDEMNVDEKIVVNYQSTLLLQNEQSVLKLGEEEYINELLKDYSMSASHLNKYLDCPVAFYFEKIIKVPIAKNEAMAFGTAVHNALRSLFENMKADPKQKFPPNGEFLNMFYNEMARQKDSFTDIQYDRRLEYGKKILPAYYKKYVNEWNKISVMEYYISRIETDRVPINGKLDKLEFTEKKVNVVDYKTGDIVKGRRKLKPPDEKNPLGGDYWRQLVFYKILLKYDRRNDWNMLTGEIDFIEMDDSKKDFVKVRIDITPEEVKFVKDQIKDTYLKIMNHEFSQGCFKEDCTWCSFVNENSKIKLKPEPVS